MVNITHYDLQLMAQKSLKYMIKIEVLNSDEVILEVINGVLIDGTINIDSSSDVRRTCAIVIAPTLKDKTNIKLAPNGLIWLNHDCHLYIGIFDERNQNYNYYSMGYYVFSNSNSKYDATTNQLSLNCSDFTTKINGTKNGQLGALTTIIPAYDENPETGEVIKYNIIRDVFVQVLKQMTNIKKYLIDDMGEYKAMPRYNEDWEKYRQENERWNVVPYDLKFEGDCNVYSILQKLKDLYPNYEMFFDIYNTFICQMIPSCYNDDIILSNEFLQRIIISEDTSIDFAKVHNICEVWGKVIETDYYTEDCKYEGVCYVCNIQGYEEKYYNGDLIAVKVPSSNLSGSCLNVNSFGNIEIYDENTDEPILPNVLEANTVYVFKVKNKRINKETVTRAYLLGHWQAHGLNVLTDGTISQDVYAIENGQEIKRFSKEYFQKKYNCESVEFEIIRDSPFAVQKLGEILDKKQGGEYENITSDSLALARAQYENWKNCRLTDCITITTILCPFLDVNIKVSYKPQNYDNTVQYVITSVSHNFSSLTSTITMYRFYPLYR